MHMHKSLEEIYHSYAIHGPIAKLYLHKMLIWSMAGNNLHINQSITYEIVTVNEK